MKITYDGETDSMTITLRDEKIKVLRAIRPMTPAQVAANTVRGQYARGFVGGKEVAGYREEPEVAPDSQIETYVALRLFLDNWRWAGTPFYLRHGKRLPKRVTEIAIQFKRPPHLAFAGPAPHPNPAPVLRSARSPPPAPAPVFAPSAW